MSGDKKFTKFPDLPYHWTIMIVGHGPFHDDTFVAMNTKTGERSEEFATYGLALKYAEKKELIGG